MHPEIACCQIIATRNQLIHEFLSIHDDILRDDKPGLLVCLKELQDESEL